MATLRWFLELRDGGKNGTYINNESLMLIPSINNRWRIQPRCDTSSFRLLLAGGSTGQREGRRPARGVARIWSVSEAATLGRIVWLTGAPELAPHGVYPLQLKQAVAALKYLLNSGTKPSQVSFFFLIPSLFLERRFSWMTRVLMCQCRRSSLVVIQREGI